MTTKKAYFIRLNEPWRAALYSDPPLGLLSVMASANHSFDGEIGFLDMAHEKNIPKADIYGLSACTLDYPELLKVAGKIRQEYGNDKKIIAGGPHFDTIAEDYWKNEIKNLPIDVICRGEGESTFMEAVNAPSKAVITQQGLLDLDSIARPAWEFLDKEKYFGKRSSTLMTSRGCSHNCSFCASPAIHKQKVRFRSVENVEKDLDHLINKYRVSTIRFQDDCFTINKKRFEKLTDMLITKNIEYRCSMRVDQADIYTLHHLHKSGCREIGFGIESAEDNILQNYLNKKTTVAQNRSALYLTKDFGFRTRAFIMTGLPGETKYSGQIMIDFLKETNPDVVTLTSFMPLPGCEIYNNPEKYGVSIVDKDWSNYNIYLRLAPNAPFVHKIATATPDEMEVNREMLKSYLFNKGKSNVQAYNKPYNRPRK
jgi:radical SAM superfamily enzyme YgiQ (UPF0313 family)